MQLPPPKDFQSALISSDAVSHLVCIPLLINADLREQWHPHVLPCLTLVSNVAPLGT